MATSSEHYFAAFRSNIIGGQQYFDSPYGPQRIVYADWTASGRGYRPIEERILNEILPFYGNTHTETTVTSSKMSAAYEEAKAIVKTHVHADENDILVFCGSGMTSAINKLQRILGWRIPERARDHVAIPQPDEASRPLVLVTHLEHHSNYVSWLETIATVETIRPGADGNLDLAHLRSLLEQYRHRRHKIAAVTACSNVTGIETPYHQVARIVHEHGGYCIVDFASSAPYVAIDMHPRAAPSTTTATPSPAASPHLDAICFSGHKFLGGPGTPGVLIFNKALYRSGIPDQPGGGTVLYSNPWNGREYVEDIEQREDGGTPPILQGIKAAMCIQLKEEMGVGRIAAREAEIVRQVFDRLEEMPGVEVLAAANRRRLPIFSLVAHSGHSTAAAHPHSAAAAGHPPAGGHPNSAIPHYNHIVRLLNDRFGIQTRGGCSCAGPYGHHLLNIGPDRSHRIRESLLAGDLSRKPGWVRLSFHPTMTTAEIDYILDALETTVANYPAWSQEMHLSQIAPDYVVFPQHSS